MNTQKNWQRSAISIAMIAVGILCLVAKATQGQPTSAAVDSVFRQTAAQAPAQAGDMPPIENAKVETRALSGPLSNELTRWAKSATSPEWLVYAVSAIDREQMICCGGHGDWNGYRDCGPCRLEEKNIVLAPVREK